MGRRREMYLPDVDFCVMCDEEGPVRLFQRHEKLVHLLSTRIVIDGLTGEKQIDYTNRSI